MNLTRKSVFLSFVLRHKPEEIGISLDTDGWTNINTLIERANHKGNDFTRQMIEQIVAEDKKGRYQISDDGSKIRAVQGHSTKQVDLKFVEKTPPHSLYHGTSKKFLASIERTGLLPQTRQYVHLSADRKTAKTVGMRHAKVEQDLVILEINTREMLANNYNFQLADNGVWLAKKVPWEFITVANF